mmetsp:Transcript_68589/g.143065  ORF Transcript_68589/g.143065 Transcript_68589/m.143065 type:complete len:340 (+) Transcript_68589:3640-4659(+)
MPNPVQQDTLELTPRVLLVTHHLLHDVVDVQVGRDLGWQFVRLNAPDHTTDGGRMHQPQGASEVRLQHHADGDTLAVQQPIRIVRHPTQPLHRMADGVPPVQNRAQPPLLRVQRDDFGLDGNRASHDLVEDRMLSRLDELDLLLTDLEEREVPDRSRLDDLRDPCLELALRPHRISAREAVEKVHVHEHNVRLVEGSDQVLAHWSVHRSLPTNGSVHHGEECCGDLNEWHSTHVGRSNIPCEITADSSSQSDAARVPVHLVRKHEVFDLLFDLAILCCLSRGNNLDEQSFSSLLELGHELFPEQRKHILVRNEAVHMSRNAFDKFLDEGAIESVLEADD